MKGTTARGTKTARCFFNKKRRKEEKNRMKQKIRGIMVLLFIAISCLSTGRVCRAGDSQKEIIYSGHIKNMIMSCESKDWMCDSTSRSIRGEYALYKLKESFLRANRPDLVHEMIEENVGIKPHQMTYYLNKRFFTVLRKAMDYCERPGTVAAMK